MSEMFSGDFCAECGDLKDHHAEVVSLRSRLDLAIEALRAIADGKVMTHAQPWPDSADDYLDHMRRFARSALESVAAEIEEKT